MVKMIAQRMNIKNRILICVWVIQFHLYQHDQLSQGAIQENDNSFSPDELHIKLKYHLSQIL